MHALGPGDVTSTAPPLQAKQEDGLGPVHELHVEWHTEQFDESGFGANPKEQTQDEGAGVDCNCALILQVVHWLFSTPTQSKQVGSQARQVPASGTPINPVPHAQVLGAVLLREAFT